MKKIGIFTSSEYQDICNTIEGTAKRDLYSFVVKRILVQIRITGKGTGYMIKTSQRSQITPKRKCRQK